MEQEWPNGALKRHLALNYPGAKSAVEAVRMRISQTNPEIKTKIETAAQTMQMTAADKFKQVSDVIALRSEGKDLAMIPLSINDKLNKMPIETVEEIRAWGVAWLEALKQIT